MRSVGATRGAGVNGIMTAWRNGGVAWCAGLFVGGALLAVAGGCAKPVSDVPVVAVLDTTGRVHMVDLEMGTVVRSSDLRSPASDIAADGARGRFLTAQCGRGGAETDDRLGIIADRGLARPSYLKLPMANPLGVEVVAPGRVVVDHGVMGDDGVFACVVDTDSRKVVRTGDIPENLTPLAFEAGRIWSAGSNLDGTRRSLRAVDAVTLSSCELPAPGVFPIIECSVAADVFGWLSPEYGEGSIARFDARTGAVEASRAVELVGGCGDAALAGDTLVFADWAAQDLANTGTALIFANPETLEETGRIEVPGGACDVQAWGDRVVVGSFADSKLLVIDPVTAKVERTIDLPRIELPFRIAVMDRVGRS